MGQLSPAVPPLVSIIIPCRNAAAWLAETIESCLTQSWPNTETIVIVPEGYLFASWLAGSVMPSFGWLAPRAVIEAAGP
jgi:cellulose synthase/poly-beta-1,6-N-acetylglucosamine synthase-like glycosyltransferase